MNGPRTYGSINTAVVARVPRRATRLLDVGCGTGLLGRALKEERADRAVVGITYSEAEAALARTTLDEVIVADLEAFSFEGIGSFDCVICSHVLEHLRNPATVLRRLAAVMSSDAQLIVALPNVLYWRQRLEFLRGRFRYTNGGLMDDTHVVFFDWQTARDLLQDSGFELVEAAADGGFPGSRWLRGLRVTVDALAVQAAPGVFGTQFVLTGRPKSAAATQSP